MTLDKEDLLLLSNSLNEVLNGLDIREFKTRLGRSREDALELLLRIQAISGKLE